MMEYDASHGFKNHRNTKLYLLIDQACVCVCGVLCKCTNSGRAHFKPMIGFHFGEGQRTAGE